MPLQKKEHFWNAVVWPILWPLLLLQLALITLVLAVGWALWWLSPDALAWGSAVWLTLALMVGSGMNVGVFLMLVKGKARYKDTLFVMELTELERHITALSTATSLSGVSYSLKTDETRHPLDHLHALNVLLAKLVQRMQGNRAGAERFDEHASAESEQALLDGLHHQQQQLKHLMAGRDRAREESRLKSGYLTVLQNEIDSLSGHLDDLANGEGANTYCRERVSGVQGRISDIRTLLAQVVQESGLASDDATIESRALKVLVVDDGPVNLMLARQMLEGYGFDVDGASSGEQALERQQASHYDLVLMDIFMSQLDGLQTSQRWREFETLSGSPPSVMVALTANIDNAGRDACIAAGMNDLLEKPYQPETLARMVNTWFPNTIKPTVTKPGAR